MSKRKRHRSKQQALPKQLILWTSVGGTLPTQEQMERILELRKSNPLINQILTPRPLIFMMRKGLLSN